MAKGQRGGKRRRFNPNNSGAGFSGAPNPYQIPDKLEDAIGPQGQPLSETDAFFDANPYYSENYAEFSQNCQRCVMAYEMRRRGFDVEALPTYQNDMMPRGGNWEKALSGMTKVDVGKSTVQATIKNIEKQMAEFGEGSRGIVRLKWAGGNSGHVINVEYSRGRLHVYDVQSNRRKTGKAYLEEYLPYTTLSWTQLLRTDNAKVTDDMRFMVKKK